MPKYNTYFQLQVIVVKLKWQSLDSKTDPFNWKRVLLEMIAGDSLALFCMEDFWFVI